MTYKNPPKPDSQYVNDKLEAYIYESIYENHGLHINVAWLVKPYLEAVRSSRLTVSGPNTTPTTL